MALYPSQSWFARNRNWVVPVGCLCPILTCVICGCAIAFVGGVLSLLKSNEAYEHAVESARNSNAVQAALGLPMEEGFLVMGNVNLNGANGNANLSIPISGPKSRAVIHVTGQKTAGLWRYSRLEVVLPEGERINLLDKK